MPNCRQCQSSFEVTEEDRIFYQKISPEFGGKKYLIPEPTLCPPCRQQRRRAHGNMQTLYRRSCDGTGQSMISCYSPNQPFPVYHPKYFLSDVWSPLSYGRDFDFSRSFFEQFAQLSAVTPRSALFTAHDSLENSEYVNYASFIKNCYLVFHTNACEDCLYGVGLKRSKNVMDCRYVFSSEHCYECIDCRECHTLFFSQDCQNCSDSWFLRDCSSCRDCFSCTNLSQKQYCIFNEQKTKTEYEAFLRDFKSGHSSVLEAMKKKADFFWATQPLRAIHGAQNENVSGDHIYECQNVHQSSHVDTSRDMKFCDRVYHHNESCYDVDQYGEKSELLYECEDSGMDLYHVLFSMRARNGSSNIAYCDHVFGCKNCFGCISLRGYQYCILNKQYSKEEYESLVPRIIEHMKKAGEWGEFFPIELSPFAYNESIAQEYYPLSQSDVFARGWKWTDYHPEVKADKSIPASRLPDNVQDIPDDVLHWAIQCEKTDRPFKLQAPELQFYRRHQLPIPRVHPDERFRQRAERGTGNHLFQRICDQCRQSIQTPYSPDRPEKVYCEACYLKQVY